MKLTRLDVLLAESGLCKSREHGQALILSGAVWTRTRRLDKPGMRVDRETPLEIKELRPAFVSRGGYKLQHALDFFHINPSGRVCLDIGASTGGFTDCLLKKGAEHVFCVDVGYGQLDSHLRQDMRVTLLEKTNARNLTRCELEHADEKARLISLITIDVSFISLKKVIAPLAEQLGYTRDWIVLFKPQFEVGRKFVGKGGVVRENAMVEPSLKGFHDYMDSLGFLLKHGPELSPIAGKKSGNLEYLIHYELHSR